MTIYDIGTGIAEVTDPAIGLVMAGMADTRQKTQGVESKLYARAFIVVDRESRKRVVIVSADIWTGTQVVKTEVIKELKQSRVINDGDLYSDDNVLISGTHTHSGPGGYSGNKLYDYASGGFDSRNFRCIVNGMVTAIENAHANLSPGKIYINKGNSVAPCGEQRSLDAFKNNPEYINNKRIRPTDREMLLLKFVALDQAGELPIGEINWYPIHPTDRGQFNHFVSGDNKGEASRLFEEMMGTNYLAIDTFVAAFANSNCGDISGNVGRGVPNEKTANDGTDKSHMEYHGRIQFDTAKQLFDSATEELSGNVDYRHTRIDMANIETGENKITRPAALGLSFAAGSSEDSVPDPNIGVIEGISGLDYLNWTTEFGLVYRALEWTFGTTEASEGHLPKPTVFSPGLLKPPIVPNILPIQILKIGNLVITGIPGEITTMAGRRLRNTVLDELNDSGVDHLAMTTYANDYSQYITTKEEYDMQHYEGASTLFGPYTLEAYQQEFKKLATALKDNMPVPAGPSPQATTADSNRRITIINHSGSDKKVEFFNQGDMLMVIPIGSMTITVPANKESASFVPADVSELKVRCAGSKILERVSSEMQIIIQSNGELTKPIATARKPELSRISTVGRMGAVEIPILNNEWLQPVLHMMLSEQPEAMQAVMYMMQDQPQAVEPILYMMNADEPESLEPILLMMNAEKPISNQGEKKDEEKQERIELREKEKLEQRRREKEEQARKDKEKQERIVLREKAKREQNRKEKEDLKRRKEQREKEKQDKRQKKK